jgi:hypothetical protein
MLILGSILLGTAAGFAIQSLRVDPKRAWVVGFIVAAGVFSVGMAMREAFSI